MQEEIEKGPDGPDKGGGREGRGDRINVGGGDDAVVRLQLAARWAETFAPPQDDTLAAALKRFRLAYDYLDAVTHSVEPPSLEPEGGAGAG